MRVRRDVVSFPPSILLFTLIKASEWLYALNSDNQWKNYVILYKPKTFYNERLNLKPRAFQLFYYTTLIFKNHDYSWP